MNSGFFQIRDGDPIKKRIPDGWKEKLLCSECEQQISIFEGNAAKFFKGAENWQINNINGMKIYEVTQFDYRLLKLFFMSVLWRAAIATIPAFQAVSLNPRHQEQLRQMLLNKDPGTEHDYATIIFKYESYKGLEKATIAPHRIKTPDHITYFQLQLNEFPCRIKVSDQKDLTIHDGFRLSEKTPLRILEVKLAPGRIEAMVAMARTQRDLLAKLRSGTG